MSKKWWSRRKKEDSAGNMYKSSGDSVSWEVAMSQAITALDHAAMLSIKKKSPSGMREVAVGWLAVASTLAEAGGSEEEEVDLEEASDHYSIGFRPPREEPEEEHTEGEEPNG